MSNLELDYQNPEGFTDIPDKKMVAHWIEQACKNETTLSVYSVSVRIAATAEAKALNKQYRHKDYATNVLSFPFDPPPVSLPVTHLGDLILCKQVIDNEAKEQHKAANDHWAHMIIHGILHLQDYDHVTEQQALEMEALEITLLKKLGIDNPYETSK